MTMFLHGKINGRTIELGEDPGLAAGADVEVQIKIASASKHQGGTIEARAESPLTDADWDEFEKDLLRIRKQEWRLTAEPE